MTSSEYDYTLQLTHNELVVLASALQSHQKTLYKVLNEQVPTVPYAPTRDRIRDQLDWEQRVCELLDQRLGDLTDQ